MSDLPHAVCLPGSEAIPEVEAEILASVYAFVLNSYVMEGAACTADGQEDGEA